MGVAFTIAAKEFKSFLNSPLAYIFLAVFLIFLSGKFYLTGDTAGGSFWRLESASLESYFRLVPQAFVLLIPALSMKLWPDELKTGTIELLMTYPVKSWQVVMGKFIAGLLLICVGLALTIWVPMSVADYGNLDWGPVWGAYIACLLMGSAFLAMGLFFGALFKEQVTAFIVTALLCGILVVLGTTVTNLFLPKAWQGITNHLSFDQRFNYLARGVVPLKDVLYFALFAVTFLVLNVTVIECRKGK